MFKWPPKTTINNIHKVHASPMIQVLPIIKCTFIILPYSQNLTHLSIKILLDAFHLELSKKVNWLHDIFKI